MRHDVHPLERLCRGPQAVYSFRACDSEDTHVHGIFEQSGGRQRHLCYKEGTCRRTDPRAHRQHGKGTQDQRILIRCGKASGVGGKALLEREHRGREVEPADPFEGKVHGDRIEEEAYIEE